MFKDVEKLKDAQGRWRTRSVFIDFRNDHCHMNRAENGHVYSCLYTLRSLPYTYNGITYPSARQIFMECEDPTEYKAAQTLFGSWEFWQSLKETSWFPAILAEWHEELDSKLSSRALEQLIELSKGPTGTQAAKYLADKNYRGAKRGRPKKNKEDRHAATNVENIQAAMKRLQGAVGND